VFCGYVKSAVLPQQCSVTAFGERLYCNVTGGAERDDKFDITLNGRKVWKVFPKYGTGYIQKLTQH